MIKSITIRVVPHDQQRYETMGDWFEETPGSGNWIVPVDDLGDWRKSFLVALHEQVEMVLCLHHGVPESAVMDFDLANLESPQPGDEPDAPYKAEHHAADIFEMQMAERLGVEWGSY